MTEERRVEQFQYKAGLLAGATAYPFFGWFSEVFLKVDFDSLAHRLPVSLFCLIFFILSLKFELVQRYLRAILMIAACWCMHDYINFFVQSDYHYYFSIGLTAMPFIIFTFFFHPVDIFIFFVFMLVDGALSLPKTNMIFVVTYLILIILAFMVYLLVTRNRLYLLRKVRENLEEIEEKNVSLIKIGELAAQVAHDIRSPVTALEAVSQMLGDDIDPKKKKLIENAAKRVNDIANDLVSNYRDNLTKDLSSVKINRSITLNSLIEDIVEEKKLSLDSKNKILLKAPESISIPENINATEFQRVISNLINNSIESFNKENGLLDVELSKASGKIKIRIRDNGKGIPSDQLQTVFDKGISTKPKGAGLGLSHAKSYLQEIGGSIIIESSSTSGTSITISL